jgi:amidase
MAFSSLTPMAIAHLWTQRASGIIRSPLHDIPFLVYDDIATKDKMSTTAGGCVPIGAIVLRDAHMVKGLGNADAVFIGYETLSQWR